jgi:hypothetical protein
MSLHDRPTLAELLAAVRTYIAEEVAATTGDRRARFRALIAANVLAITERELASAPEDARVEDERLRALGYRDGEPDARRRRLCAEIRAGGYDAPARFNLALEYAREMVARKLAVANPKYLARG